MKYKKQAIQENDLLHLGRETFVVMIKYKNHDTTGTTIADEEEEFLDKFKCKACGNVQDMNLLICDKCGSYGQIEPLDE